jgi:hypothetical protein
MPHRIYLEPVEDAVNMPGSVYAHVPSLGPTTHGHGVKAALEAARDLIDVWMEEKRAPGDSPE